MKYLTSAELTNVTGGATVIFNFATKLLNILKMKMIFRFSFHI